MRYEKYVFSLGLKVCPVATRIINPWPFTHYVSYASAYENIGWMVFLPFTVRNWPSCAALRVDVRT